MKKPLRKFGMAVLLAHGSLHAAELNVLRATEVDPVALNFSSAASSFSQNVNGRTYQRSPMSTFKGYQYTTYYDSSRHVCLSRRKLPSGAWETIRFTDYAIGGSDSHNVVTLGICAADGTIHLAFDHHADPLNYRVSSVGAASSPEAVIWSSSLFGSVTDNLGSLGRLSSVTYPSFFNAPNGNLMLYYRFQGSGSGDGMIHEYDGTTHEWTPGMGKFIARNGSYTGAISTNSTSRNPYINGISYAGTRLHASWGWRESSGGSQFNHDLNYAYSDDDGRTWNNSAGTRIGTTNSSFININSPDLIVASIPQNIGLSNQYTHYAYPDGSCHVIVAHQQSGTSNQRYHHYWRNAVGNWSGEALPFTGSRPKLVGDDNRELFLAYSAGGTLRVAKGSPNATRTAWTWSSIHAQGGRSEGGEGQIDTSRWEADRILSVYGQDAGNAAGDPTPLRVFDYQVSSKAILPIPVDQQVGIGISPVLEWTGGIGASTHRIYFGLDPEAVAAADTSSPEYLGEQATTTFVHSSPLDGGTSYYWRIDEIDGNAEVHKGLVWSFVTVGNAPPTISGFADQVVELGDPIPELSFTIGDDLTDSSALVLSKMSSTPGLIPDSGITISGSATNRGLLLVPSVDATGTSVVTVGVSDGVHLSETSFSVTIVNNGQGYTLYSAEQDASIREVPDVVDITNGTTLLGTGGSPPWVDRCTVYVFRLPDFGSVAAPFTTAGLTFEFAAKQNDLQNNDLYGLGRRILPDVLPGDYYGQTATPDPSDALLLESNILDRETPLGVISTSVAGSEALRAYLNTQYASGTGAGQFVFLRLNTAGAKDGIDRATLTMSEGGSSGPIDTRPRLEFTTTVALSGQQEWRATHFGNPFNLGPASDEEDPDGDGENNYFEFVTGQDPHASTLTSTRLSGSDGDLTVEFIYSRNTNAVSDGNSFTVEWSDTLLPDSWSDEGVNQVIASETGSLQTMSATIPVGNAARRFARLRVTMTPP